MVSSRRVSSLVASLSCALNYAVRILVVSLDVLQIECLDIGYRYRSSMFFDNGYRRGRATTFDKDHQ